MSQADKTAERRALMDASHRAASSEQRQKDKTDRKGLDAGIAKQKEQTARNFQKPAKAPKGVTRPEDFHARRPPLSAQVRGEAGGRSKVISPGFNAHGQGPVDQKSLRDAQVKAQVRQQQRQERERGRQKEKAELEQKDKQNRANQRAINDNKSGRGGR